MNQTSPIHSMPQGSASVGVQTNIFDAIAAGERYMPRARRTDPETSHRAAAKSRRFSESHAGRIHLALIQHGRRSTFELSQIIGLTVVQIDRRKSEMEGQGLIRTVGEAGGYSVLEAVSGW